MTDRWLIVLAAGGSMALLAGALYFQYGMGLLPCPMCLWQRWPHVAAVLIGMMALGMPSRAWSLLGAAAAAVASGLGVFHAGVEQGWWQGPTTCSAAPIGGLSPEALLDQIMAAPVVRCDEIAWSLMGISMPAWNAILSLGLVVLWLLAFRAGRNSTIRRHP